MANGVKNTPNPSGAADQPPTLTECVRRMLVAFASEDHDAFRHAAGDYAFEERRRNHHVIARDFEQIIASTRVAKGAGLTKTALGNLQELPRDRERGLMLIELRDPQRSLEGLNHSPSTRRAIERVIDENRQAELLKAHGLRPMSKLLFCGPPGCGKTVTAEAIARELYLPLAIVRFDAVVSSYLGETASNLARVFEFAQSRPVVMLFDEFDAIGKRRTDESEHGELKRVVNALLQLVDRFLGDSLMVAATNHEGLLDNAVWRRFDDILSFPRPKQNEIAKILARILKQTSVSPKVSLDRFSRRLVGMSHGDVERLATEAVKEAVLLGRSQVDQALLESALVRQRLRNQKVSPAVRDRVRTRKRK